MSNTKVLPSDLRILVIGAGLGGLATATHLRHAGAQVTLLEKNEEVGGKIREYRADHFRWDMGPSLLTMPDVLHDFFSEIDLNLNDHLELEQVHPTCRYFWKDGTVIDENEDFFERKDVSSFLKYAEGIYELSGDAFLSKPPRDFWKAFTPENWPKLKHLPKVATFQSVSKKVDAFFQDPHLQQLFKRYATYNGSSPYRAPATFNVIPYVEAKFGGWYLKNGMAQLTQQIARIAEEKGVVIHRNAEVIQLDNTQSVKLRDGRVFSSDVVVVNGDVIRSHRDWIRLSGHRKVYNKLKKEDLSLSGFILFLGIKHKYGFLSHHNIFFSENYEKEFASLFEDNAFPEDPTIYISITSRTQSSDAPEGCDNYFVLVNAPPNTHGINWETEKERYTDLILDKLHRSGLKNIRDHIVHQHVFTPYDFSTRDLTSEGALYGWASHKPTTSLWRPPLQSKLNPNVFFVGGTTHPGGGIPLVLLSSKMVCEKIKKRYS